jgi:hypothetical protein
MKGKQGLILTPKEKPGYENKNSQHSHIKLKDISKISSVKNDNIRR